MVQSNKVAKDLEIKKHMAIWFGKGHHFVLLQSKRHVSSGGARSMMSTASTNIMIYSIIIGCLLT